jgi:perosamine synthetase
MIKLSKPDILQDDINNMVTSIKSGDLVQGKFVSLFENQIRKYLGIKYAALVSSGTAALHLSLLALNINNGDEIIAPAFTFPATTNVIELVGARTVLVDINLSDFCINVDQIEAKITKKTKAILIVHEFGQPADMSRLMKLASKYSLQVIEDAACAFGAEYNNQKVGTFGNIGCFSLHPRKAITTGEGGIIVTNNQRLAKKIEALRNHGISTRNGKIDFTYAGLNYRLTDFQAALGINQLKRLDKNFGYRKEIMTLYNLGFKKNNLLTIPKLSKNRKHALQSYHLLINQKINRNLLIKKLKAQGIETNYGAYAIHMLSYYRNKYHYKATDFKCALFAYKRGLVLPIGSHLTSKDIKYVIKAINQFSSKL